MFRLPTAPLPPLILRVPATTLPAVWVIVPTPVVVRVTDVVPVTVAPNANPPLPAVRLVVGAVRAPVVVMLLFAALALSANDVPLLAPSDTAAAVSTIETAPVEFATNVVAFVGFAADKIMPPVPACRVTLALLRAPAVAILLAAALAVSVNVEPELAASDTALAVSVMFTAPVEFAVIVVALTELMDAPAAPEDSVNVGVVRTPVDEMPPELAVIEREVEAE